MSVGILKPELLSRIEGLLDALEVRGKNSTEFLALCSDLESCIEMVPVAESARQQLGDINSDSKNRLELIIKRIKMLETFSTSQTEITSNLQKHIVGADK